MKTEELREFFTLAARMYAPRNSKIDYGLEFDRWLQSERARIWEDAFQIGWNDGVASTKLGPYRGNGSEWYAGWEMENRTANPYRGQQ